MTHVIDLSLRQLPETVEVSKRRIINDFREKACSFAVTPASITLIGSLVPEVRCSSTAGSRAH